LQHEPEKIFGRASRNKKGKRQRKETERQLKDGRCGPKGSGVSSDKRCTPQGYPSAGYTSQYKKKKRKKEPLSGEP